MSIRVRKSDLPSGGFEQYLREEHGLRDDVELVRTKDGGMYGNRIFVFEDGDGERLEVDGYVSSPPVATYSLSGVWGEKREWLFGGDD